jgi:hypothetical protein
MKSTYYVLDHEQKDQFSLLNVHARFVQLLVVVFSQVVIVNAPRLKVLCTCHFRQIEPRFELACSTEQRSPIES